MTDATIMFRIIVIVVSSAWYVLHLDGIISLVKWNTSR